MSQAEPSALQPGTLVQDRYRVMRAVGKGGLSTVYQVADILYGKANIYALKEQVDQSASARKQFAREGAWLKALSHPSIPKVTEYFEWRGRLYLVMEFVEGENLERKLERAGGRPLPEAQVMAWVLPICDALLYLHSRMPPIIHRDVKPSNIIVTPSGHTVLVDLGIAKEHLPGGNQTATFVRKAGTEGYAAPEQYSENGQTGPWSDVYGLGATLYHLFTAQIPPTAVDRVALDVRLRPPRELNPAVSVATEAAILRALAIRPQDRFRSMADFKRALPAQSSLPPAGAYATPGIGPGRMDGAEWPSTPAMSPPSPVTPPPTPYSVPSPMPMGAPPGSGALRARSPIGASPVPVRPSWTPATTQRHPVVGKPNAARKPTAKASMKPAAKPARGDDQSSAASVERGRLLAHPVLWGVGLAAVAVLLVVGIYAATQVFAPLDRSTPTNTVTGYFAALNAQDYSRAWQYMAASQRGQTSEADFTASLSADDAQYGRVLSSKIIQLNQDASGHVSGTINVFRARAPSAPIVYTAALTQYGGQWMIDSLVTS